MSNNILDIAKLRRIFKNKPELEQSETIPVTMDEFKVIQKNFELETLLQGKDYTLYKQVETGYRILVIR